MALLTRVLAGLKRIPLTEPAPQPEEPQSAAEEPAGEPAEDPAGPDPADGPALAAIRTSFDALATAGDKAPACFYASLFASSPKLRELFPPAMDEQRDRLLCALRRIVDTLATPEELATYLAQLGRDHRKYAVTPEMYEAVGGALNAALRQHAGETFTAEAQQAWGQAYQAASSMMIRAAEDDAARSPAYWTAEVTEHEDRGNGIAAIAVAPSQVLPYEAGQHVTVQVPRWPRVWRPYSVARRPREDGLLSFHVRAITGGWVSSALVHHTKPGDEIIIGPALGAMTLPPSEGRDVLCVAGGTGLAPIKAIAEQVIRDSVTSGRGRQVFLYCGARTRDELYDLRDLWRLTDAYEGLHLTPVTSCDPAFAGMQGNVGRVAARYMPHRECEAYVAGPEQMVRETIAVLGKAGLPRERIHYDDALLTGRERVGTGT
jgi:NAD(P)H-flavin reductase/hemoglobin-like flavoprotein